MVLGFWGYLMKTYEFFEKSHHGNDCNSFVYSLRNLPKNWHPVTIIAYYSFVQKDTKFSITNNINNQACMYYAFMFSNAFENVLGNVSTIFTLSNKKTLKNHLILFAWGFVRGKNKMFLASSKIITR